MKMKTRTERRREEFEQAAAQYAAAIDEAVAAYKTPQECDAWAAEAKAGLAYEQAKERLDMEEEADAADAASEKRNEAAEIAYAAAALGRRGGSAATAAQAAAARENGKKGGRPRKAKPQ
jgi:hypothetical protein